MNKDKLLIIEDDIAISTLLSEVAQGIGYETSVFDGIEELKKKYSQYHPSIIFLDLGIPDHDGVELLKYLSEVECTAGVIIISGHDEKVRASAFNLGTEYGLDMLGHYQKPISVNELSNILESAKRSHTVPTSENLVKAINEKAFVLLYQPMIQLSDNKLFGFEAQVKWKAAETKLISQEKFMPIVEKHELIQPLTKMLIEILFHQYTLLKSLDLKLKLSIDLSSSALIAHSLTDEISKMATSHQVDPNDISFEITENAVMSEVDLVIDVLTRLRLKGFRVVLDRFGTGYSTLAELHRLPFNGVKMDKTFSKNLKEAGQAQKIVKSIIDLAHNLNLIIIADGVESKEAYGILKKLECDIIQGKLISKPMDSGEIYKWIKKNCNDANEFVLD